VRAALVLVALALVVWVRLVPLSAAGPDRRDEHGHAYLGDYDSYLWLRSARNWLRTGTVCDAVVDGECRDTLTAAPVGARMRYAGSLHVAAIVAVHRLTTLFDPDQPLAASAWAVPVVVGALGVFPAFGIGRALAGDVAGVVAAVVVGLNPDVLQRTIGSDNDVWNVVLPLWMIWAVVRALGAARPARQVGFAALAAVFAGLQAGTWSGWTFGYGVVVLALAGNLLFQALARALRGAGDVGRAARVLAVLVAAGGLAAWAAGAGDAWVALPRALLGEIVHGPAPAPDWWPDLFATVAELERPGRDEIVGAMGGAPYLFAGWLGLLALLLPERDWRPWHFAVLIGGTVLFRWLLVGPELGRAALLALLALPLGGVLLLRLLVDPDAGEPEAGGRLVVAAWFLAAVFFAYAAARFVMLLAAPFAVVLGVAVGRAAAWAERVVARSVPRLVPAARVGALIAAGLVLVLPVRLGRATALSYESGMDDAWWETLGWLRDHAPPDAIVDTWWDYGYWTEYVAERRTSADGGSLRTHVPHWIGRALVAPTERETVGLLRMLACGSDATPEPEGRSGAWGRLVAHGVDPLAAHALVDELARADRPAARATLAARGLSPAAADDVLASTHCTPPPTYLILSDEMIGSPAWAYLGSWDPARAWMAGEAVHWPEERAVPAMAARLGWTEDEARNVWRHLRGLDPAALAAFVAPRAGYAGQGWIGCEARPDGDLACAGNAVLDAEGALLVAVDYRAADPAATRLRVRPGADFGTLARGQVPAERDEVPSVVLVARDGGLAEVVPPSPSALDLGVLVDPARRRVLVGAPFLLRATFTRLALLDGRGTTRFRKVFERSAADGGRVVTWAIDWDERS
jgi:dolichyl-phosphooligosaccharide-protein glycotransferase